MGELAVGHHDRGGMDGGMPRDPLKLLRRVQQPADALVFVVLLLEVGGIELVIRREHVLDRHGLAGNAGDQLRNDVDLVERHTDCPTHVAHCGARLHAPERHNLRHAVVAILLPRVLN